MVFIFLNPMNWVKVPKTGSTVLCRLPCGLSTLAMVLSYSSRLKVTLNFFSWALFPIHWFLMGQSIHTSFIARHSFFFILVRASRNTLVNAFSISLFFINSFLH
ncbi:hypothetical protein LX92_04036 [Maribacter polysiphoniae]|uniref:Uncharacterized protein n=1 Tax=Maribacter polysiphoniae TaxID=429344 RepID=A0A316DTC5_9FLAO|nr:hypothetical protein LX92_04036 [Maribacter polysiphoniae]